MDSGSTPGVLGQAQQSESSPAGNMQTGIFLQQFANSVNRALHKQHCTCNGRLYTADELLSKSNSAIYGPSKSKSNPQVSNKARKLHLPPINGLNLSEDDAVAKTAAPLKNYLDREVNVAHPVRNERLVTRSAPAPDEELRLPSIMDIRDTKGNNWKILQEQSGSRHRGQKKPLQLIRRILNKNAFYNPHIYIPTDVNGNVDIVEEEDIDDQDKDAIESVLEANTPSNSIYNPREGVQSRANDITEASGNHSDSDIDSLEPLDLSFPDLAPSVCNLAEQIKGVRKSCFVNSPDDVYHDELERKALLSKYSSEVRRRKISYIEYLRKISQMTICPCIQLALYRTRDKRMSDVRIEIMSAKRVLTAASRLTLKSRSLPAPDFASNVDTLSLYARGDQDFTNELETLYTRTGAGIATLQISGDEQLPKNFLDREREELRLMYPMYDWRIQYNQQLHRHMSSLDPTLRNSSDTKTSESKLSPAKGSDNRESNLKPALKQKNRTTKQQSTLETMTGHSVTFSSSNVTQQSNESIMKPRVPNQPPTTPVEAPSLTIASASAPELLTINENEENERNDNDEMVDDNNNEIGEDKIDQNDPDNFEKSVELHKSEIPDDEVNEQNDPHLSQSENIVQPSSKTVVDLKYNEQNSSVHYVSPASSMSNSAVTFPTEVPVVSTVVKEVRPSVQLLQIDANAISRSGTMRSELSRGVDKGGPSGHHKVPLTQTESPANHLRPAAGVARLATHKVVFVSPAVTQA
ncbi:uncharacterized protein [Amphiura filiformis]|uniref:uncharacterized protein n=1 Tax=Amphiura filiformis TaxID=82378 RepID=UPI003B2170E0